MDNGNRIGYSLKIKDPAFRKYISQSNRWSVMFSLILAIAAIIGFTVYGEQSRDMDNPQALFIGLGIGAMFLSIAFLQVLGRKRSRTWDGVVKDKYVRKKSRRGKSPEDGWYRYLEYTVVVKAPNGKEILLIDEDDDTKYNYYQVGDHVRHHGGLNSFEKFDKSNDSIIFCNACASLNDIEEEVCFRCGCPLLK